MQDSASPRTQRSKSRTKDRHRSRSGTRRVYRPPSQNYAADVETGGARNKKKHRQSEEEAYYAQQSSAYKQDWDNTPVDSPASRYPNDTSQSVAASQLTDSFTEDRDPHDYQLAGEAGGGTQRRSGVSAPSPKHRKNLNKWYQSKRLPLTSPLRSPRSMSSDEDESTMVSKETMLSQDTGDLTRENDNGSNYAWSEDDYWKTKQGTAYLSIALTAGQLLVLMLQMAMCGVASLDVNPMVGPFPDAFSEWGGKNAYLMLNSNEWWRVITPAFLHVGVLHLFANAFCQLETVALFEREWGSFRWLLVYLLSAAGCTMYSALFDPDNIAVGSSGALMGMYAAKLSQVMSHTFFDVTNLADDAIRLDQLSGVLCGLTLVSLLSCFSYIDWSGHMGGLITGLFAGMVFFCRPITSCCARFLWALVGLVGVIASFTFAAFFFVTEIEPDEELGDACEYFRNLFPEDYECGCLA